MARQTKAQLIQGVISTDSPRIIDNNTIEYHRSDGARVIRHFFTDILIFHTNGDITYNNGGYESKTTKDRINEYQDRIHVYQEKHVWFYVVYVNGNWDHDHPKYFDNGMMIDVDGKLVNR